MTSDKTVKDEEYLKFLLRFGENVRTFRKVKFDNQEQFAAATHYDRCTISRIEGGFKAPRLETIFTLAKTLGVSPDLLLKETDGELQEKLKDVIYVDGLDQLNNSQIEMIKAVANVMANHMIKENVAKVQH